MHVLVFVSAHVCTCMCCNEYTRTLHVIDCIDIVMRYRISYRISYHSFYKIRLCGVCVYVV